MKKVLIIAMMALAVLGAYSTTAMASAKKAEAKKACKAECKKDCCKFDVKSLTDAEKTEIAKHKCCADAVAKGKKPCCVKVGAAKKGSDHK